MARFNGWDVHLITSSWGNRTQDIDIRIGNFIYFCLLAETFGIFVMIMERHSVPTLEREAFCAKLYFSPLGSRGSLTKCGHRAFVGMIPTIPAADFTYLHVRSLTSGLGLTREKL